MKTRTGFTIVFFAAFTLLPSPASALSFRQFDSQTRDQQAEFLVKAVDKIVTDVAPINPALSKTIRDYFVTTPAGKPLPPGMIAFGGAFVAVEEQALEGKLDLDKVQIEGILLGVVKRDVMPTLSKNSAPSPPAQKEPVEASEPGVKESWITALAAISDQRLENLRQSERVTRQQLQEADCRAIRLRDGRTILVGEHGEYIDEANKQVLHGADEAEARRNEVNLSDPATLNKYRQCLAQHGISKLDRTVGKQ